MKIWDTFCYNGETHALQARLAVSGIDHRVLVESRTTHSGLRKDRLYSEDIPKLEDITVVIADLSSETTPWGRENAQRNAIMQGIRDADCHDIVLISDADEVMNEDAIVRAREALRDHVAVVFSQRLYNFNKDCEGVDEWRGTICTTVRHLRTCSPQSLRDKRETLHRIRNGGVHLSFFGGLEEVRRKLCSFAHTEYAHLANNPELLLDRMSKGEDLFGRAGLIKSKQSDNGDVGLSG